MPSVDKLNQVSELIKYILYSDYIKLDNEKEVPVSALIIASIESGKTSIISQFDRNDGLLIMTDVTAYGLQKNYLEELKSGRYKRIIIPDLINPISRKQETVNNLITFFNAYISWEGVQNISTYAMDIKIAKPFKGSILTTIASRDYTRVHKSLAAVGFMSRLLPITYEYSQSAVRDILIDIAHGNDKWARIELNLPKEKIPIELSNELAEKLIPTAMNVTKFTEAPYGIRALHHLKVLVRSRALANGRDIVNNEDIETIQELANKLIGIPKECKTENISGFTNE